MIMIMKVKIKFSHSENQLQDCIKTLRATKVLIINEINRLIKCDSVKAHRKDIRVLLGGVIKCNKAIKKLEKELKSRGE